MTLKKYLVNVSASLTVYAEDAHKAEELALDYCSELECSGNFIVDIIDDPILKEESP